MNARTFNPHHEPYYGPADGRSHPRHRWLLRPALKMLSAMTFRREVTGRENLPAEGSHVYCPNHPSYFDALVVDGLVDDDVRYLASVTVFDKPMQAKALEWFGAFPVNQDNLSSATVVHAREVLKQGANLCIFPEGEPPEIPGTVGEVHPGAARFAMMGGAETLVPMGIAYRHDDQPRWGERLAGWGAAALTVAAGVAGSLGSPAGAVVSGALGGALAGAYAAGRRGFRKHDQQTLFDPLPGVGGALGYGAAGALAGAAAGAAAAVGLGAAGGVAGAVAGGIGVLGIAGAWRTRPVVSVSIGRPLRVEDYSPHGRREGSRLLTAALQSSLEQLVRPQAPEKPGETRQPAPAAAG